MRSGQGEECQKMTEEHSRSAHPDTYRHTHTNGSLPGRKNLLRNELGGNEPFFLLLKPFSPIGAFSYV